MIAAFRTKTNEVKLKDDRPMTTLFLVMNLLTIRKYEKFLLFLV